MPGIARLGLRVPWRHTPGTAPDPAWLRPRQRPDRRGLARERVRRRVGTTVPSVPRVRYLRPPWARTVTAPASPGSWSRMSQTWARLCVARGGRQVVGHV